MSTQFAYVVIDPHPGNYPLGIKRYRDDEIMEADERGQYMVYIKIGDTHDPKQRLPHYSSPSQCIGYASITNVPDPRKKVGKQFEDSILAQVGKTDTEWHALYAKDVAGAKELTSALWDFIRRYRYKKGDVQEVKTVDYNTFSGKIRAAIEPRFKDHGRHGIEVPPETPVTSYGVYVIVTPNLASMSQGLAQADEPEDGRYLISIKTTESEGGFPIEAVHRNLKTVMPSFSFNGFVVSTPQSQYKMKELKEYQLERILGSMRGCTTSWEAREWTGVTGAVNKSQLRDFMSEFAENIQEELDRTHVVDLYFECRLAERMRVKEGTLRPMFLLKILSFTDEDIPELSRNVDYERVRGVVRLRDSPYIKPADYVLQKWFNHREGPDNWVTLYGNYNEERDAMGHAINKFMGRYPIGNAEITRTSYAKFCKALSKLSDAIPVIDSEIH